MNIRTAATSDVGAIIGIDHVAKTDASRSDFITHAVAMQRCLVVESDDEVAGYGVLEYAFFGNGFISMLYVAASERRRGVGSALLEALADRCTTQKLFTSANESNAAMHQLLKRHGYVPSGVIHNLDPGDPEIVYFRRTASGSPDEGPNPSLN